MNDSLSLPRVTQCRICKSHALLPVVDLGVQALTGRFVKKEEKDPLEGPLQLVLCQGDCGLVQLAHHYPLTEMYGPSYGYRSSINETMVAHLRSKVATARDYIPLQKGDAVLDIGCNDGTLLRLYQDSGILRWGIDPSSGKFRDEYPEDVHLIVDFFSHKTLSSHFGDQRFRIITSIAMFYDVEYPLEFMECIAQLLTPDGVWVFEQSYTPTMIQNGAYDTICHEHLNYYNMHQITWMAKRAGLKILDVEINLCNGSSFSVVAARIDSPLPTKTEKVQELLKREECEGFHTQKPYLAFAQRLEKHKKEVQELVARIKNEGSLLYGYGASTKGNVMLQYCEINVETMPCIADRNPAKYGLYTPKTKIPIISEEEARQKNPDYFMVLPWHFHDAVIQREARYLQEGGSLLFCLPEIEIVRSPLQQEKTCK